MPTRHRIPRRRAVAGATTTVQADVDPPRLANLDYLDYLYDKVSPPEQNGHSTNRLEEEPNFGMVWVYCQYAPDSDEYCTRIGSGAYDAQSNTWGQGAFNTDEITRNAVAH